MAKLDIFSSFKRFIKSEQHGSVIPMVGIGIFAMMSSMGASIDMSRAQLVQARMSSALDTAGLAAASTISTTDFSTEANKYFNANFPTNYLGTTVGIVVVSANSDNTILTLTVDATVPTTIMRVVGMNSIPISARSEITRSSRGLEVVMVMDVTGSMDQSAGGGVSKITAAKNAANSLVSILFGNNNSVPNLWIGLVPFTQTVNIGTGRGGWTNNTAFTWGNQTWKGCVESRSNGTLTPMYDVTDDTPTTRLFNKYYAPDQASTNNWIQGSSNNTYVISATQGPNVYCREPVTPLTASKTTITTAINAMTTGGGTQIPLGVAWGWRMISPKWRGLWGGEMNTNSLPLDYNTPLMNKAMIIMTDGMNTAYKDTYSAYGVTNGGGQLGSNACTGVSTSGAECPNAGNALDTKTTTVCANIKANNSNVIIYTVALGTSFDTATKNMLEACASKPEYYFNSPTTADLNNAFNQIGDSLANLRISK